MIYVGPRMSGYKPMRFEFLHVRWFNLDPLPKNNRNRHHSDWASLRLDRLTFPPMNLDDSFGFLDPSLVLRACHIIPAYNSGKLHADGVGRSPMAMDGEDWNSYYVNRLDIAILSPVCYTHWTYLRFADRDMVMRYHWGLGIGHAYSHSSASGPGNPKSRKNVTTDSNNSESAPGPPYPSAGADSHNISQDSAEPANLHEPEGSRRPAPIQNIQPGPEDVDQNGHGSETESQDEENDSGDADGADSASSSAEDCDTEDEFGELELHDSYQT